MSLARMSKLSPAQIRVITIAPYTTNAFQELDLCPFGVSKKRGPDEWLLLHDKDAGRFLIKA
jgi:hypothetical protein